ncbi:peptidase family m20/M25/M40 domain-containing protein [Ditylenchus destructor]|uniref:N-acyl-aliphatic-L-amino acid amidohydrolase n=1 Tax=Ditylenchus destructor TaxID=166010 RepID=A0AAD4N435_9BILA|nr:peptidase family m20/M25/M40 domain-containing protein [Ditylenchus destructor]
MTEKSLNDLAVSKFRKYLQVKTEQPNPDYESCKKFLLDYAKEVGLNAWTYECIPGKPFVGMTIPGKDPSLNSLLLYSHTDVVPTFPEQWVHDPYGGLKDENGDIYGRGTQDTKCLGIQYIEAIRRLKQAGNASFLRTIHLLYGPDEEIGGKDGMGAFVKTEKFKELNVGFALDESHASEKEEFVVHYGERCTWWLKVTCCGTAGHGSRFIEDNAGAKFLAILNRLLGFREEQYQRLKDNPEIGIGNVTTVNLTQISGGIQPNVLPAELIAYFDIRLPPTTDFHEFEKQIEKWCEEAGSNVKHEFVAKSMQTEVRGYKMSKQIAAGASDSKFLREIGIKALGFNPTNNTPVVLHMSNEFISEDVLLVGIDVFVKLIPRLANVPKYE